VSAVGFDDLQGEVLQFAEQGAELLRVVEQGLVFGELAGGEPSGDGLAVDLAGPFGVGSVKPGRVGVAAAARLAAGVGADGEGAGQGEARLGELRGDPVAGRTDASPGATRTCSAATCPVPVMMTSSRPSSVRSPTVWPISRTGTE
jgi:hypothetical protein